MEQSLRALSRKATRLEAALRFNAEHRERRYGSHVFDDACVATHVAVAIDRAPLDTDPMAHLVVDGLLPRETYDALVDAIPPAELFSDKDDRKQNFKLHAADAAPEWTVTALSFMEDVIIPRMIVPGLLQKFDAHVRATYEKKYGATLGAQVAALPHIATAGRLMLRRPGYHLEPHLDPDRVVVTCLIYFARPGDDESFGTSFYRIDGDPVINRRNTFFPRNEGYNCDLVKTAPFRPEQRRRLPQRRRCARSGHSSLGSGGNRTVCVSVLRQPGADSARDDHPVSVGISSEGGSRTRARWSRGVDLRRRGRPASGSG